MQLLTLLSFSVRLRIFLGWLRVGRFEVDGDRSWGAKLTGGSGSALTSATGFNGLIIGEANEANLGILTLALSLGIFSN